MYMFIFAQFGRQSIHYACAKGHIPLVTEIVEEYNVDPSCKDNVHTTVSQLSALVERNDVQEGNQPIHVATAYNQIEVVKILIEKYNADPAAADLQVDIRSYCSKINECLGHSNFVIGIGSNQSHMYTNNFQTRLHTWILKIIFVHKAIM